MKINTVFLVPFAKFGIGDSFEIMNDTKFIDLVILISKKHGNEFEKMLISGVNNEIHIKDNVMILHKGKTVKLSDKLSEGEYVFCAVIAGG
ncbi:MAG: hypothetical protein V1859_07505 [archaeon]